MSARSSDKKRPVGELFPLNNTKAYQGRLTKYIDIGIDFDMDPLLRKRLIAAAVSLQLGYSGIDSTLKGRLRDYEPEDPYPDRIDLGLYSNLSLAFDEIVSSIQGRSVELIEDSSVGHFLSDATIIRLRYTLDRALAEASVGALFESAAVLRLGMEKFSWACRVRAMEGFEEVQNCSATKAIGFVKRGVPEWGLLYGLLSNYSHWEYSAHANIFRGVIPSDAHGVMLASTDFKAVAYVLIGTFVQLVSEIAPSLDHYCSGDVGQLQGALSGIEEAVRLACRELRQQFPEVVLLAFKAFSL
jgi:hypothetical protein